MKAIVKLEAEALDHLLADFEEFIASLPPLPEKILPTPYTDPFRPINPDEMHCIMVSCQRNRIPWIDFLADTPANLIQVSFSCNSAGFTQCVIFCQHESGNYLFLGVCKLLPTDSFDKAKGQKLAFYRAVTEAEAIALPSGIRFFLAD